MNIKKTFYHLKWIYLLGIFAVIYAGLFTLSNIGSDYSGPKTTLEIEIPEKFWLVNFSFTYNDEYVLCGHDNGKIEVFDADTGKRADLPDDIFIQKIDKSYHYIAFSKEKKGAISGLIDLKDLKVYPLTGDHPVIIADNDGNVKKVIPNEPPKKIYFNNFYYYLCLEPNTDSTNIIINKTVDDSVIFKTALPNVDNTPYQFEIWRGNELRVFTNYYDEAAVSNSHLKIDLESGKITKKIAGQYDYNKKKLYPKEERTDHVKLITNIPENMVIINSYKERWRRGLADRRLETTDGKKQLWSFQDDTKKYILSTSHLKQYKDAAKDHNDMMFTLAMIFIASLFLTIILKLVSINYPNSLPAKEKFALGKKLTESEIESISDEEILEQIVLSNKYFASEKLAAMKVNFKNQKILKQVFNETTDKELKSKAIQMTSDEQILKEMFKLTNDTDLQEQIAINKISDNFFLEAQYPTASNYLNLEIIKKSIRQDFLKNVTHTDKNSENRIAAAEKLIDEETLFNIASDDEDKKVQITALKKIKNEQFIIKIAQSNSDESVRSAAIERISDKKVLETLYGQAKHSQIKQAAAKNLISIAGNELMAIKDNNALKKIIEENPVEEIKLLAICKISDFDILESIASEAGPENFKDAANKTMRNIANERVSKLKNEKELEKIAMTDKSLIMREMAVINIKDKSILKAISEKSTSEKIQKLADQTLQKRQHVLTPSNLFTAHTDKELAIAFLKDLGKRAKAEGVYSIWSWVDSRNGKIHYQFIPNIAESNNFEFDSPTHVTEKTMLYEQGTMRVEGRELADGPNWAEKGTAKETASIEYPPIDSVSDIQNFLYDVRDKLMAGPKKGEDSTMVVWRILEHYNLCRAMITFRDFDKAQNILNYSMNSEGGGLVTAVGGMSRTKDGAAVVLGGDLKPYRDKWIELFEIINQGREKLQIEQAVFFDINGQSLA